MEDLTEQEFEQAQELAQEAVNTGEKFQELLQNETFQELFQERFVNAFAVSAVSGLSQCSDAERQRVIQKMHARGVFTEFCQQIVEEHRHGIQTLTELKELAKDSEVK